jgi:flagellar hook protein FlgE
MSFSAALTGLAANQQKLAVIGNNLANINTVAFKASDIRFGDLLSQSASSSGNNPAQVGIGVTTGTITSTFSQGGVDATGVNTHVAIQGNGFFIVGGETEGYTRAGDFAFDATGQLVTSDGLPVLGYTQINPLTGEVVTTGTPAPIVVAPGSLRQPVATTVVKTVTNLDAETPVGGTFASTLRIYDSVGASHTATVTFTKTGNGAWTYAVTVPGEDIAGGVAGAQVQLAAGNLAFNAQGTLAQVNGAAPADVVIAGPAWANGAAGGNLTWELVGGAGAGVLTGFRSPSATASTSRNGSPAGVLTDVTINTRGEIEASFGGESVVVAQLAMMTVNNPLGLVKAGGNLYRLTQAAGEPNIGVAGEGGRGILTAAALERSNIDIAREFTQMILAQRGYQANSKTITVVDEMFMDAINLKR